MRNLLKVTGILLGLAVLAGIVTAALMPWMDRWGATDVELAASLPGDELVPLPRYSYNRAVTVHAAPEQIFPWLLQMGAERGGLYSYTWIETYVLQCKLVNADRVHPEWQALRVGDQVKMCPGDFGPPPYDVASIEPDHALVLGHYENGVWLDTWQFILMPQSDGTTRLLLRARDMKTGWIWSVIRPGQFIMERGMLLGIKARAEANNLAVVPTPQIFLPQTEAVPRDGILLEGVHLDIAGVILDQTFPASCTGSEPACTQAGPGHMFLSIAFTARDRPEGQMLAYKNLPTVQVVLPGEPRIANSIQQYDSTTHILTIGFRVPEHAAVFGLKWDGLTEIPLYPASR